MDSLSLTVILGTLSVKAFLNMENNAMLLLPFFFFFGMTFVFRASDLAILLNSILHFLSLYLFFIEDVE